MLPIATRVAQFRQAVLSDPEAVTPELLRDLAELDRVLTENPLQGFEPHRCKACGEWVNPKCRDHAAPQYEFLAALTRIVAAFAGNRFGKTTALLIRALIECVDEECLPEHLRRFKRWNADTAPRGTFVRIVVPSTNKIEGQVKEELRRWCPPGQLVGGSLDKAWRGAPAYTLRFSNGSLMEFMSYEMDLNKFGGVPRHVVGYDEPPPWQIRQECQFRTIDYGGYELFAMTPLKSNVGWIKRDIFKKRESPDITVVRGSIHDNPTLDESAKNAALGDTTDIWRRAREYGDFVDVGGLIFNDYERWVVDPLEPQDLQGQDVVVGIDPGIRNAGFSWNAFDRENVCTVFDEALLQNATVDEYVDDVRSKAARWGLKLSEITFVIDPAARSRGQTNAESVETALARLGIYTVHGQNSVEAGINQINSRGAHRRYLVSRDCRLHRDQADEYAAEDRDDGQFRVIKTNDHVLDAARYAVMHRPWDLVAETQEASRQLGGWKPNVAPPASRLGGVASGGGPPMGPLS